MEQVDVNSSLPIDTVHAIMENSKGTGKINNLTKWIAEDAVVDSSFMAENSSNIGAPAVITELMFIETHMKLYPINYRNTVGPFQYEIEYRDYFRFHRLFLTFQFNGEGKIKHISVTQKQIVPFYLCFLSAFTCSTCD